MQLICHQSSIAGQFGGKVKHKCLLLSKRLRDVEHLLHLVAKYWGVDHLLHVVVEQVSVGQPWVPGHCNQICPKVERHLAPISVSVEFEFITSKNSQPPWLGIVIVFQMKA